VLFVQKEPVQILVVVDVHVQAASAGVAASIDKVITEMDAPAKNALRLLVPLFILYSSELGT
jgi:hypothetical protein